MFSAYISIVYCTFGIRDCVRVNEDLVISRFCLIYFILTLVGLKRSFVLLETSLYRGSLIKVLR